MLIVACEKCGKKFYGKPFWLKKGWGKYCSADCHHASMRNGKEVLCSICGKLSYKTQKGLKGSKSGKYFCTKRCQTLWRNQLYIGSAHKNFKTGEFVYRGVLERGGFLKYANYVKLMIAEFWQFITMTGIGKITRSTISCGSATIVTF